MEEKQENTPNETRHGFRKALGRLNIFIIILLTAVIALPIINVMLYLPWVFVADLIVIVVACMFLKKKALFIEAFIWLQSTISLNSMFYDDQKFLIGAAVGVAILLALLYIVISKTSFVPQLVWVNAIPVLAVVVFVIITSIPEEIASASLEIQLLDNPPTDYEYMAMVKGKGGYGFVNERGEYIFPCQFYDPPEREGMFREGYRMWMIEGEYYSEEGEVTKEYLLDAYGHVITDEYCIYRFYPEQNLITLGTSAMNANGEIVIPEGIYDSYEELCEAEGLPENDFPEEEPDDYNQEWQDKYTVCKKRPYDMEVSQWVDDEGNIIVDACDAEVEYNGVKYPCTESHFEASEDGKYVIENVWGFVEKTDENNGETVSTNEDNCALYDSSGKMLIPLGDYVITVDGDNGWISVAQDNEEGRHTTYYDENMEVQLELDDVAGGTFKRVATTE